MRKKDNYDKLIIYFFTILIFSSCQFDKKVNKYNFIEGRNLSDKTTSIFYSIVDYKDSAGICLKKHFYFTGYDSLFSLNRSTGFFTFRVIDKDSLLRYDGLPLNINDSIGKCRIYPNDQRDANDVNKIKCCVHEIKRDYKINDILIKTCIVFKVETNYMSADDFKAFYFYDKERKLIVKRDVTHGRERDFEIVSEERIDTTKIKLKSQHTTSTISVSGPPTL